MKKKLLLLTVMATCLLFTKLKAQVPGRAVIDSKLAKAKELIKKTSASLDVQKRDVDTLIKKNDSCGLKNKPYAKMISSAIYDTLVNKFQDQVAGTFIKDGKSRATSVYVDGKSLTINVNAFKKDLGKLRFLFQPTGTAIADSGTVSIFSGGKYNQRAFSGGLNFFVFNRHPRAKYYCSDRVALQNALKAYDLNIVDEDLLKAKSKELNGLFEELKKNKKVFLDANTEMNKDTRKSFEAFESLCKLLKTYLPKQFDDWTYESEIDFILGLEPELASLTKNYALSTKMNTLDSLQKKAYWSSIRMFWISGSVQYNSAQYPVYDAAKAEDLYTAPFFDKYFSFSAALNFFVIRKNSNIWFAPTLKFKHNRDFDPKDKTNGLISIQKTEPYTAGTETLMKTTTMSFYRELAAVKRSLTTEWPVGLFFPKSGFGFEVVPGAEILPKVDNASLKTGIFIPFTVSDKTTLTLEPYIKLQKLFKGLDFRKEVFTMGLSLSATLPTLASAKL